MAYLAFFFGISPNNMPVYFQVLKVFARVLYGACVIYLFAMGFMFVFEVYFLRVKVGFLKTFKLQFAVFFECFAGF